MSFSLNHKITSCLFILLLTFFNDSKQSIYSDVSFSLNSLFLILTFIVLSLYVHILKLKLLMLFFIPINNIIPFYSISFHGFFQCWILTFVFIETTSQVKIDTFFLFHFF